MSGCADDPGTRSTRRRRVVHLLDEVETPVTVDQLVDELRERAPDDPAGTPTWETLHERLHDEDLPALDRAGLLVFHEDRGLVTCLGEDASPRSRATGRGGGGATPESGGRFRRSVWGYVAVGAVSMVALGAAATDLGPFARVPDLAVSGLVVLAVSLASVAGTLRR